MGSVLCSAKPPVDNTIYHNPDYNKIDRWGETRLHNAIQERDTLKITWLLKGGCEINIVSNQGKTPLLLAIETNDTYLIALITGHYTFSREYRIYDPKYTDDQNSHVNQNETSKTEYTPDPYVITCLRSEIYRRIKLELDLNHTGTKFGITLLHVAVMVGNLSCVKLLLESKFPVADVNIGDRYNDTPLMYAAYRQNIPVVNFLLKHGANPRAKNDKGQKAKDWCLTPNPKLTDKLNTAESFILVILAHKHDPNSYLHHYNIARDVFKFITRLVWKYIIS